MYSRRGLLTILAVGGLAIAVAVGCATMRTGGAGSQFVGSEKCAACHAAEYKTWKETNHAKMVRPLKEGLLKDALRISWPEWTIQQGGVACDIDALGWESFLGDGDE